MFHQHHPGCGHTLPDYDNFPMQTPDPRRAYSGDDAMQDSPHPYEMLLAEGSYAPFVAMQESSGPTPGMYNGLPDYVTWDVYTPQVTIRGHLPGPDVPNV